MVHYSLVMRPTMMTMMEDDRIHAGLRNLSAALDDCGRVSRAESSGFGGCQRRRVRDHRSYAIITRRFSRRTDRLVNDSGPGIARGLSEPEFIGQLIDEFGASRVFPPSCADCIDDGHLTGLMD